MDLSISRHEKKKAAQRTSYHVVFTSEELKTDIEAALGLWRSPNRPFMRNSLVNATYIIRDEMWDIGEFAKVEDRRPHRVRDTFAVRKLLKDVSIDDVSKLLGHTSVTITEQHYATWVPARTRRLEGIVAESNNNGNGRAI